MNMASLKAKGVEPASSQRAELQGWRLKFNVAHFFRHEGGVGNIEFTGDQRDTVLGVVHECHDDALPYLDDAEAFGYGYDRIKVKVRPLVKTNDTSVEATTYVGMPSFIDEQCLPSQRYLNIVVDGAKSAGLAPSYIAALEAHPTHRNPAYPEFEPPYCQAVVDRATLEQKPMLTALYGHAFDMSNAREQHTFLKSFFAGKDMTLFHLQRMDSSTQNETIDDIVNHRLRQDQKAYLNAYLHEYAKEYEYVGRYPLEQL